MLNWYRNFRWNKRRLLFRYHDGKQIQSADPVEIAIALHAHPTFLYPQLKDAVEGDAEAQKLVAQAASDVFGVKAYDGDGGLTVAERIELLMAFDLYLMELKKNTDLSLTPATFTAATSTKSEDPTTNDMSDSGSIGTDHSSEAPTSSEPDPSLSTAP